MNSLGVFDRRDNPFNGDNSRDITVDPESDNFLNGDNYLMCDDPVSPSCLKRSRRETERKTERTVNSIRVSKKSLCKKQKTVHPRVIQPVTWCSISEQKQTAEEIVDQHTATDSDAAPAAESVGSNRDQAALIIQSQIRKFLVQKTIILPRQITDVIVSNFPDMRQEESNALSNIIARQSVAILENPKEFQGEGKRINNLQEEVFIDPVTKEIKIIKTPRTIWIHLGDNQKEMSVQVYSKKRLGSGTYKIAKASKTLVFNLSGGPDKIKKVDDTVYLKSKDFVDEEKRKANAPEKIQKFEEVKIADMRTRMDRVARIFTREEMEQDKAIHLKALPSVTRTYIGKKNRKRLEWEEPMYFGCDYYDVLMKGSVVVDGGVTIKLNTLDKLRIVKSILYTTQKMHEKGFVHSDVKGNNIFLGYDGQLQGYLGDFDLVEEMGLRKIESEYEYWDRCAWKGLLLPVVDVFGSAMVLGESFLGSTFYEVSRMRLEADSRTKITNDIDNRVGKKSRKSLRDFNSRFSSKLEDSENSILSAVESRYKEKIDFQETIQLLRDHITTMQNVEIVPEFKELLADLELIYAIGSLLKEVFDADMLLDQYLNDPLNRSLKEDLMWGVDKDSLARIYNQFPLFKNLFQMVVELETQWNATRKKKETFEKLSSYCVIT